MKVGILTREEFAFGCYGGFGYVARKTANLLNRLGHDVHLIDISPGMRKKSSFLNGIPVHFLINKRFRLKWIEQLIIVRKFIKKLQLDVLVNVEANKWIYYFRLVSPRIKSLVWFQDVRTDEDWRKIFTNPIEKRPAFFWEKLKLERLRRKMGIKKSNILIAQAELIRGKVKKVYNVSSGAVILVPNPIPIPSNGFIMKSRTPLVIFLGRLDPIKRPWIFAEIARKLPDINFLLLGKSHTPHIINPIMEKYKKIKNLKFLGLVTGKKKAYILSKAWILVNTSIYESLPVSFLEALSYKMAILSCNNPDGIVSNYGYFTGEILGDAWNDVDKFVDGLKYLISNDRWIKKGREGYKFVKRFADERKIIKTLDKILNNL